MRSVVSPKARSNYLRFFFHRVTGGAWIVSLLDMKIVGGPPNHGYPPPMGRIVSANSRFVETY